MGTLQNDRGAMLPCGRCHNGPTGTWPEMSNPRGYKVSIGNFPAVSTARMLRLAQINFSSEVSGWCVLVFVLDRYPSGLLLSFVSVRGLGS